MNKKKTESKANEKDIKMNVYNIKQYYFYIQFIFYR